MSDYKIWDIPHFDLLQQLQHFNLLVNYEFLLHRQEKPSSLWDVDDVFIQLLWWFK